MDRESERRDRRTGRASGGTDGQGEAGNGETGRGGEGRDRICYDGSPRLVSAYSHFKNT
jgi:hypothetical protein